MTILQLVETMNEAKKWHDSLVDFSTNAAHDDRFLSRSDANHLAAILKNLMTFVKNIDIPQ